MSNNPSVNTLKPSTVETTNQPKCIVVCQHRRCVNLGSRQVLAAFLEQPLADYEIIGSGCLKQCGNGPMVRVIPDQVWYHNVQPSQVSTVVEQHLLNGSPVEDMLYPRFHPQTVADNSEKSSD